MMDILNDDCLKLILQKLNIKDKIVLANTCQHLRDIIKDHLRTIQPICLDENVWYHLYKYESKPEEFLSFCSQNIQEMHLDAWELNPFKMARNFQYPQLKSLKIERVIESTENEIKNACIEFLKGVRETLEEFSYINSNYSTIYVLSTYQFHKVKHLTLDDWPGHNYSRYSETSPCMEKMGYIFPSITNLTLMNPDADHVFHQLKNLVELKLVFNSHITLDLVHYARNVKKIIISKSNNSCHGGDLELYSITKTFRALEFLQTDCHVLSIIISHLNIMTNIRKFVFTHNNLFFCLCKNEWQWNEIFKFFKNRLEYLAIDSYLLRKLNLDEFFSIRLLKLRRLAIFDRICIEEQEKRVDQLKNTKINKIPKDIRDVLGWRQSIDEIRNGILKKLQYYINLESFDVSANICDLEFLKSAIASIHLRNQEHYKAFTFRCFKTNITEADLKELVLPCGVQVLLINEIFDIPRFVVCEMEIAPASNLSIYPFY